MVRIKTKIDQNVEFCSLCPFGKVSGPVWDSLMESEVYTVKCEKQNGKIVHDYLCWYECASQCDDCVGCHDVPPVSCPFQSVDNQQ